MFLAWNLPLPLACFYTNFASLARVRSSEDLLDFPDIRRLLATHKCNTDNRADMTDMTLILIRIFEILWLYGIAQFIGNLTDLTEPGFLIVIVVVACKILFDDDFHIISSFFGNSSSILNISSKK